MCTVTFIPVNDKFIISSNRDEKNTRGRAMAPVVYSINKRKLIFPKDADGGGSWIALHENGNSAVLLNGAFENHIPSPPYLKSRGQVFLNIIASAQPTKYFNEMDLQQIEPFTIILLDGNHLYENRWDGKIKYFKQLNKHRPYIWSSATLYDNRVVKKREKWFASFLDRHPHPTQKDILEFHQFTGDGDKQNDFMMERDGLLSTVSITSILLTTERGSMKYLDMKDKKLTERKIEFESSFQAI